MAFWDECKMGIALSGGGARGIVSSIGRLAHLPKIENTQR